MDAQQFSLLVADDNPENLRVLAAMLKPEGYAVRVAPDGKRALASMEARAPDLVLLDIHMPELDGYGTFQKMKESPDLAETPVIFLTALNEAFHKVKAFDMGAADYICKPFEAQEVLARVSAQLRLLDMRRSLQERNRALEAVNAQLQEHERFRQLFYQMLVHDMRGPLTAILGVLELLREESISDNAADLLRNAMAGAQKVGMLVDAILDVSKAQAGALKPNLKHCDLAKLTEDAIRVLDGLSLHRQVNRRIDSDFLSVCCDPTLIERVVINLVDNAFKHTPDSEPVDLSVEADQGVARVRVSDRGPGIPPQERERIFDLYTNLDSGAAHTPSTGLGLAFCKLALAAHGEPIAVENREGGGAVFTFSLPLATACPRSHVATLD